MVSEKPKAAGGKLRAFISPKRSMAAWPTGLLRESRLNQAPTYDGGDGHSLRRRKARNGKTAGERAKLRSM
jgi:hypothetical protein